MLLTLLNFGPKLAKREAILVFSISHSWFSPRWRGPSASLAVFIPNQTRSGRWRLQKRVDTIQKSVAIIQLAKSSPWDNMAAAKSEILCLAFLLLLHLTLNVSATDEPVNEGILHQDLCQPVLQPLSYRMSTTFLEICQSYWVVSLLQECPSSLSCHPFIFGSWSEIWKVLVSHSDQIRL